MEYIIENEVMEDGYHLICVGYDRGHRCGYVGVKPDHPWYGKDYTEVEDEIGIHGGLTFSDRREDKDSKFYGEDLWYFWFDCAHAGDRTDLDLITDPYVKRLYSNSLAINIDDALWTQEMVMIETTRLYEQLKKV